MSGGRWAALLVPAALAALVGVAFDGWQRIRAGRLLRAVEQRTTSAVLAGRAGPGQLDSALLALDDAERLDPAEVGVLVARGSIRLILRQAPSALEAYRRAIALEPRPEIYLNVGKAHLLLGDAEEAEIWVRRAVRLDPFLRDDMPVLPQKDPADAAAASSPPEP